MAFSRVLVVVSGDESDAGAVGHAADLVRNNRGAIIILYVILVDRSLPVDAEVADEVSRGERVLTEAEGITRMPRSDVEAELLQAREVGPAVVHEAVVREMDAVIVGTPYPMRYGAFSLGEDIPYILEHAPCHVILWREPMEGFGLDGGRALSGRASARIG